MCSNFNTLSHATPPPPRKEKNELPQKFKPPRSGNIINICAVKSVTRATTKKNYQGKASPKMPRIPCGERDPHTEKETPPPPWRN